VTNTLIEVRVPDIGDFKDVEIIDPLQSDLFPKFVERYWKLRERKVRSIPPRPALPLIACFIVFACYAH